MSELSSACPECGNFFKPRRNKTYCSHSCRTKASIKRNALDGIQQQNLPTMKNDLASYLLKEVEYWKDAYIRSQQRVEELQVEKKEGGSGLGGLLETPLGQALIPAISKFAEKMVEGASTPVQGMAGPNEPITLICNYFLSQKPELQEALFKFIDHLAGMKPDEALQRLNYFNSSQAAAAPVISSIYY